MALDSKVCLVIHDETPSKVADRINELLAEDPNWEFSPIRPDGSGGHPDLGEPWYLSTLVLETYEDLELELEPALS